MPPGIAKLVEVLLSQSVLLHIKNRGQWAEEKRLSHCSFIS